MGVQALGGLEGLRVLGFTGSGFQVAVSGHSGFRDDGFSGMRRFFFFFFFFFFTGLCVN